LKFLFSAQLPWSNGRRQWGFCQLHDIRLILLLAINYVHSHANAQVSVSAAAAPAAVAPPATPRTTRPASATSGSQTTIAWWLCLFRTCILFCFAKTQMWILNSKKRCAYSNGTYAQVNIDILNRNMIK
jgi:hypothetical protein